MSGNHRPRRRFGQNFLHDRQVIGRILRAVAPRPGEALVEIGPGEGALTGDLLRAAAEAGWDPSAISADLTELLRDPGRGRTIPADRTLFSSVGHAYEDLLIARAVVTA